MNLRRRPQLVAEAAEPAGWVAGAMRRKVLVHMVDDLTIEGVLVAEAVDGLILRAARLLSNDPAGEDLALAGETHIPRGRVAFMQCGD